MFGIDTLAGLVGRGWARLTGGAADLSLGAGGMELADDGDGEGWLPGYHMVQSNLGDGEAEAEGEACGPRRGGVLHGSVECDNLTLRAERDRLRVRRENARLRAENAALLVEAEAAERESVSGPPARWMSREEKQAMLAGGGATATAQGVRVSREQELAELRAENEALRADRARMEAEEQAQADRAAAAEAYAAGVARIRGRAPASAPTSAPVPTDIDPAERGAYAAGAAYMRRRNKQVADARR